MKTCLFEKRILIVSDDEMLCWAIESNLDVDAQIVLFVADGNPSANPVCAFDYDLGIVAVVLPSSGSMLVLTLTAMIRQVGPIPMSLPVLVISDRPFCSVPSQGISYLKFPFEIAKLNSNVRELIHHRPQLGPTPSWPEPSRPVRSETPRLGLGAAQA